MQVAGRAGRGDRPGRVLMNSLSVTPLQTLDYRAFADAADEQSARLPPFSHQALLRADATRLRSAGICRAAGRCGLGGRCGAVGTGTGTDEPRRAPAAIVAPVVPVDPAGRAARPVAQTAWPGRRTAGIELTSIQSICSERPMPARGGRLAVGRHPKTGSCYPFCAPGCRKTNRHEIAYHRPDCPRVGPTGRSRCH